jgi:hypothetical protein
MPSICAPMPTQEAAQVDDLGLRAALSSVVVPWPGVAAMMMFSVAPTLGNPR